MGSSNIILIMPTNNDDYSSGSFISSSIKFQKRYTYILTTTTETVIFMYVYFSRSLYFLPPILAAWLWACGARHSRTLPLLNCPHTVRQWESKWPLQCESICTQLVSASLFEHWILQICPNGTMFSESVEVQWCSVNLSEHQRDIESVRTQ